MRTRIKTASFFIIVILISLIYYKKLSSSPAGYNFSDFCIFFSSILILAAVAAYFFRRLFHSGSPSGHRSEHHSEHRSEYRSGKKFSEPVKLAKSENFRQRETITPAALPSFSFNDVAGLEEVKSELHELIDFLKSPEKYKRMGARLPKGVLFYGPPGTGKTLLAKAIAGEANASFHFACGSEFVEKYVGVGAGRVRALFEHARKEAPSIIFIDEIDGIGSKRTSESNNEKDQTLNQLLVEMDGFSSSESVIVIAATNRSDLLDEALTRPGRFDRKIFIGNPDLNVREKILNLHLGSKPVSKDVIIHEIARRTPGMSGAHLADIANESAILAVRNNSRLIGMKEIDMAIEKVIAGPERRGCIISETEKRKIACHEAGHAIVAKHFGHDTVPKISIIPRGQALGYTMQIPGEDHYLITENEMLDKIKVLFGGRAAEEFIWNELSSGAADDLKKATEIALQMVFELGMSKMGNIVCNPQSNGELTSKMLTEVQRILNTCYHETCEIIRSNSGLLSSVAERLLINETIFENELDEIIEKEHDIPVCMPRS